MNKKNRKGFTIVELVIVIAVIAILATVLAPTFGNVIDNAKNSALLQDLKNEYTQYVVEAGADFTDDMYILKDGNFYKVTDGVPSTTAETTAPTTGVVFVAATDDVKHFYEKKADSNSEVCKHCGKASTDPGHYTAE